jgi:hypothetical protein
MPTVVAAVLLSSELGPFTRCAAIATVLHRPILELRPSWRAEPLRLEGQRRVLALSKSCSREARGIEGRASAERCVHLQAVDLKAGASPPLPLHFKEVKCDDYHRHRACQVQQLVIQRAPRC